jgi:hypothetical protein
MPPAQIGIAAPQSALSGAVAPGRQATQRPVPSQRGFNGLCARHPSPSSLGMHDAQTRARQMGVALSVHCDESVHPIGGGPSVIMSVSTTEPHARKPSGIDATQTP